MNTTFFQKASENKRSISWGDIFSDVWKKHRKDQRTALLTKGMGSHIPAPKPNAFRLAKTMAVCPYINRRSGYFTGINWNKLRYLSGPMECFSCYVCFLLL